MDARETAAWWTARGEVELGQLLYWRWDPIGLNDVFPNTAGEYDDYAWPLAQLAIDGAGPDAIAESLHHIECDSIGLSPHPSRTEEHRHEVAEAILYWYQASIDRWATDRDPSLRWVRRSAKPGRAGTELTFESAGSGTMTFRTPGGGSLTITVTGDALEAIGTPDLRWAVVRFTTATFELAARKGDPPRPVDLA
ncbi:hypothetical protein [Conexibacter woesei]|uniref:hypothetical protein n=1 Tax=Conexibacter woesei TaxID=191495 RepID=UPI00042A83FF|nr:hypothetical protein [Conexibacter woesei]